jgi:hypothetical protein
MKIKHWLAAVALSTVAAASAASAAVVYDTITVYDSSNNILSQLVVTQAEQAANPSAINFLAGVPVDASQFGNYGIVLVGSTPVDIFGIALGGPDPYDLAFSPGEIAATYPIQNPIAATGAPIDMTQYLDVSLREAGDTAFFTASGDFNIGVPEPSSWLLMVAGVGAIGGALRTTRRRTLATA